MPFGTADLTVVVVTGMLAYRNGFVLLHSPGLARSAGTTSAQSLRLREIGPAPPAGGAGGFVHVCLGSRWREARWLAALQSTIRTTRRPCTTRAKRRTSSLCLRRLSGTGP